MVILSAGICDKIGKILLSRQFGVVPKRLLEELYYSFPKMIKPGQQHTYVESDVPSFQLTTETSLPIYTPRRIIPRAYQFQELEHHRGSANNQDAVQYLFEGLP